MALVTTNGEFYVTYNPYGEIRKTHDFEEAIIYEDIYAAICDIKRALGKTKNYYIYDTVTEKVCWKKLTHEEHKKIGKRENLRAKRKNFSNAVRKRVYAKADGYCQLCGRKITYDEMTLDHIHPLAMGGEDAESNLQCACRECNELKRNILPEDFMYRINTIFCFQMKKRYGKTFKWKIAYRFLRGMLEVR